MTKRDGISKSQVKTESDKKPKTMAKKKVERKTLVIDDTSPPKAKGGGRRGKPLAQVADNTDAVVADNADVVVTDIASADDNAEACADDNAEADTGDDANDNANDDADDNVEAEADDNADAEADAGDKKEVKKVSDNNTDVSGWNEIKTLRTENRMSKKHSRKNKPEIDNNTNSRASVNPSRKNISNTGLTFIQNSHGRFEQSSNQSFNQSSNQSFNTGYASRLNTDNSSTQQSNSRGVQFERRHERRPERRQGGVLSFDRVDALTSGNKKMSECDDETILKYMIAVTEKRSQKMLADLYKNILTGIKLETPLPTVPSETTAHTSRDIHFLTESRPWRRDRSDRDNRGYYNRSSTRG